MEENVMGSYILASDDEIIEISNPTPDSLLENMLARLYESTEIYKKGQNDRAVLAKWKTNVRYQISENPLMPIFGYKQISVIDEETPVILLSRQYLNYEEFMQAFQSLIWVTYRSGFEPITHIDKVFTSDTGWGCTIRVGQMLLLNALKFHFQTNSCLSLLELIQENLAAAPFSLHKIVECGKFYDKSPGDWYSPSLISHVLQNLSEQFKIPALKVMVFMDSVILKNLIPKNRSVLLLIPLMLGITNIQEEYYETVKLLLSIEWSVGIIGGIPKSALYIVGYQENGLIFLDPHLVQPACTSGQDLLNKLVTYSCSSPKLLPITNAESSISVGLYFRSFEDFEKFEKFLEINEKSIHGVISVKHEEKESKFESESEEEYYLV